MDVIYDVIIVLAGGIQEDGSLPKSVRDRVDRAKNLFDLGLSSKIILAGKWSPYWNKREPPSTEAEAMRLYALTLGIPESALLKEEKSYNTASNILEVSKQFLRPKKYKRLLIVTSDFHVPRVKNICKSLFGVEYHIRYESVPTPFSIRNLIFRYIAIVVTPFLHRGLK